MDTDKSAQEGRAQAEWLREKALIGGLKFEAYLPSDMAAWILDLVKNGVFRDPAYATFVMLQQARELEDHADLRDELLRRKLQEAIDDPERIPFEEVEAEMDAILSEPTPDPAVWQNVDCWISDAEDMLHDIAEIDRMSGGKLTEVTASTIRQMLTVHGFHIQLIADLLDIPIQTVEQFADEMRETMMPSDLEAVLAKTTVETDRPNILEEIPEELSDEQIDELMLEASQLMESLGPLDVPIETKPEQIVELLPHPVVELISELSGSDDPDDQKLVAEFLRETAHRANAILYERGRDRIAAQLPPGALDRCPDDE